MTVAQFRKIATRLPEAIESAHMGRPDFRVRGKVFASLGYPDAGWGMVKLTPEQQALCLEAEPAMFAPAKGAWGKAGSTCVAARGGADEAPRGRAYGGLAQHRAQGTGQGIRRGEPMSVEPVPTMRSTITDEAEGRILVQRIRDRGAVPNPGDGSP